MPGKESRDGALVRALASHQIGAGSLPGPGVISEVLGSRLALKGFLGFVGFRLSRKTNISKFQFDLDRGPVKTSFS